MSSLFEIAGAAPWIWVGAGLALCAIEVFTPGAFLLWFGLAALTTGLVTFLFPLGFGESLTFFSAAAIAFVMVGRVVYGAPPKREREDGLNRGAEAFVGHEFVLEQPIESGVGFIKVRDSIWRVEGPDAPAGTRVRVTEVVDGVSLRVELIKATVI